MEKEYVKGNAYFTESESQIKQHNYLDKNLECDVLVIGGGINGLLAGYYFSKEGVDTILIDKGRIARRSTALATVLLEYQLDDHAEDLRKIMSEKDVVTAYKIGKDALKKLDGLILEIGNDCHYSARATVKYTLKKKNIKKFENEFLFRLKHGFEAEFITGIKSEKEREKLFKKLDNKPVFKDLGFDFVAGIFASDGGAEFNPYLFCKLLLEKAEKNSLKVYENTEAIKIVDMQDGKVKVLCGYGYEIKANKVVIATGYSTEFYSKQPLCEKFITFSITTNQQDVFNWENAILLQDDGNPYHYIKLLPNSSFIIGGEDIKTKPKFVLEKMARKKYEKLLEYLKQMHPDLKNKLKIERAFCGEFSATKNNLGVFGKSKENENVYYCLGYGANGIINCIYATEILLDLYKGKNHPNAHLFSANRKALF